MTNAADIDSALLAEPAWRQAEKIRSGQVSAVELMDETLKQIARRQPTINAYTAVDEERARQGAAYIDRTIRAGTEVGPLAGLPTAIKDVFDAEGFVTSWGSTLLSKSPSATGDDLTTAHLKSAGAVVIGKTNVPEFAALPVTQNPVFGVTRNPFDSERVSGGSSGGSGAAMAAGMASIATATDGGGSTRTPAAVCGLVGLKPTAGRIPVSAPDAWGGIVAPGVVTRTVRDHAEQLEVLGGVTASGSVAFPLPGWYRDGSRAWDRKLRIAWSPTLGYGKPRPEVIESCEATLRVLEDAGHAIEVVDHVMEDPWRGGEEVLIAAGVTYSIQSLGGNLDDPALSPSLASMYTTVGRRLTAVDYVRAQVRRHELRAELSRLFDQYDVLCTPTLTSPAMRHDEDPWPEEGLRLFADEHWAWFAYTYPFNFTGLPAVSVPSARAPGNLPVGFQIVGPLDSDALLLELAADIEQRAPWDDWPI